MELTNLDVELILFLNSCHEVGLSGLTVLDIFIAKPDSTDQVHRSLYRLEELGLVSMDDGDDWPLWSLNDVIKCNTTVVVIE